MIPFIKQVAEKPYEVNEREFFHYFDVLYDFSTYDEDYHLNISLVLKGNPYRSIASTSFYFHGHQSSTCNICGKSNCEHIHALIKKAHEIYGTQIEEDVTSFEKKLENKLVTEDQNNFLDFFKVAVKDIENDDELSVIEEVKIEPEINYGMFTFKVGRKRMYAIKTISSFLFAIKNRQTISYGKELSFIHDISVFDEKGQRLISHLLEMDSDKLYRKSIPITESFLAFIMNLYHNDSIMVDGNKTFIRLNVVNPTILIDKQYHLVVDEMNRYQPLIPEDKKCDYVIDKVNNIIDLIASDDTYKGLIFAAIDNPRASIKPILDDFKYSYYLKYQDKFVLDTSIADKFAFDAIKIQAFFDYDDKKILLTSKIFKDEQEASYEQLSSHNKKQVSRYIKLITSLGFVDNELTDESDILNFLTSDLSALKAVAEVYLSDKLTNKKIVSFAPPTIRIAFDNNMMDVFVEEGLYSNEELEDILAAIRKKRKFVILKNNTIVKLDEQQAEEFANEIADLGMEDEDVLGEKHLPLYQVFKAHAYSNNVRIDKVLTDLVEDIRNFKEAKYPLPDINASLRSYQVDAFKWLKTLCSHNFGGILADDMGLGKTLEMISVIADSNIAKPSLIVCPKSLIFNWMSEFNKFANNIPVEAIYGTTITREKIISTIKSNEKKVYITSYDSLRNDVDFYEEKEFEFIILDEAQFIKNVYAQKTKSVKKLNGVHKFALTGTPIENNIIDLWSIFDFIMPGYLLPLDQFKHRYDVDNNYSSVVFKKVSPFILRRNKKDVLKDLPDKYEVIMSCEMGEEQLKLYEAEKLHAKQLLAMGGKPMDVMYLLTRLRQICVEPSMYIENYYHGSGKMDALMNIVEEHILNNHRILIFSQFVKALNIIEKKFHQKNINYRMITGDTKAEDRLTICNEFNNNEDIEVVLISLKAGGTGLNLTGADTIIHLDPWWNVAAQNQATDRAHRIGQTRNVEVIKLICENSIEQRVVQLQNLKQELIDKIISNDESSITNITMDDLSYILE